MNRFNVLFQILFSWKTLFTTFAMQWISLWCYIITQTNYHYTGADKLWTIVEQTNFTKILVKTMKGLDTVESLSAGAAWLKVQYPRKKYWHYFHCPKNVLSSILSFIFWIFVQSNAAVVTSSKNLYIGPLVTLRRPRGFRQCRAPSWLICYQDFYAKAFKSDTFLNLHSSRNLFDRISILRKGLDTVESLSAGAAGLKVRYTDFFELVTTAPFNCRNSLG